MKRFGRKVERPHDQSSAGDYLENSGYQCSIITFSHIGNQLVTILDLNTSGFGSTYPLNSDVSFVYVFCTIQPFNNLPQIILTAY